MPEELGTPRLPLRPLTDGRVDKVYEIRRGT